MSSSPAVYSPDSMRAEKRAVAGSSVLAAMAITLLKIVVAVSTGSLGILSEAAHSGLDLIAAIITFFSVRVSDLPADADHQYGHGKVENFSAFMETGLLLLLIGRNCRIDWLRDAVPIAALFVAGVVVYVRWRLARKTIDSLLDAAPTGVRNRIIDAVSKVEGVLEIDRVRIRRAGNRYFADLSVGLARNVTFQRSEQVADAVTTSVHRILPDSDVMVHSSPRAQRTENIFDRIRAVATRNNLNVHDVSVQDLGGHLHVEQHLELDERLTLKEAHDQVTLLESEMRDDVPELSSILTHIESEPATIETGDEIVRDARLERRLKAIAAEFPEIMDMHDVQIKRVRDRLYVSCHCTLSDDLPLSRVHDISTALETRFKHDAPELFRVLIHPEPKTDNRR